MEDLLGMPAAPPPAVVSAPTPAVGSHAPAAPSGPFSEAERGEDGKEAGNVFDNLRWLISIVDRLRDIGLQKYISLPRICAIGGQSAGKSSLVESICGLNFLPRGEGTVTRRPLELRLVHATASPQTRLPYATFDVDGAGGQRYYDFAGEVRSKIEAETERVAGVNRGIVDDPIIMTVYSADVMDLTVIDLPGITRVPVAGTDQHEDIEQVTRDLTLRYVADPNTLILACIPGNVDLSVSDALQLARRVDPDGRRTLGVLTKIDLMDRGCDAGRVLRNEDIRLALGYVAVRLRSQAEIRAGVPVSEAAKAEADYFAKHPIYSKMAPALLGVPSLVRKLNSQLERVIAANLPSTIREISAQRHRVAARLAELGRGVPGSLSGKQELAYRLVSNYCTVFSNSIRGRFDRHLHQYYSGGVADGSSGGSRLRAIMNDTYGDNFAAAVTDLSDAEIDRAVRKHEGDSLPGFPSPDTFEYLVQHRLKALRLPAQECVSRVAACLDALAQQFGEQVFRQFPPMGAQMVRRTHALCAKLRDDCSQHVEEIIDSEVGYIFTNDDGYLNRHSHMLNTSQTAQAPPVPPHTHSLDGIGAHHHHPASMPSASLIADLRARLDSYFSVVLKNVSDSVPRVVGAFLIRELQERMSFELHSALQDVANGGGEGLSRLLGEPPHVSEERESLSAQLAVLVESEAALSNEPSLAMARLEVGAGVKGVGASE